MDVVLVSITGISLALVVAMGCVLFKLLRDERLRSDARVALLAASAAPARAYERVEFETPASARDVSASGLFTVSGGGTPWPRRAAIAVVLALGVTMAGYLGAILTTGKPAATVAAAPTLPLELLTLGHTQQGDALVVRGTVLNPRGSAALAQVQAIVFAFSADGAEIGRAQAGLDYRVVPAGGQSPFVVSVPGAAGASRYRVGFRAADGAALAHIDRRVDATAARTGQTSEQGPWAR